MPCLLVEGSQSVACDPDSLVDAKPFEGNKYHVDALPSGRYLGEIVSVTFRLSRQCFCPANASANACPANASTSQEWIEPLGDIIQRQMRLTGEFQGPDRAEARLIIWTDRVSRPNPVGLLALEF
jgi:hypothetical protein